MVFQIADCKNYEDAKELFLEYSKLKGAEQCFVSFESELQNIEQVYPKGFILLGTVDEKPVGCIAIKKIDNCKCELKRLYIKEMYRGNGYSNSLFHACLDRARNLGFSEAVIHTLPDVMKIGYMMYLKYGFVEQKSNDHNAVVLTKLL